jgi:hypothetical protein
MNYKTALAGAILGLGLLAGCQSKTELAGFDAKAWKQDMGSCTDTRKTLLQDFENVKDQLFGKSEKEIKAILGRPDGEELMERSQRFFYYYIEPGTHCQIKGRLSEANRVQIRFSSLSRVNEITYAQPVSL